MASARKLFSMSPLGTAYDAIKGKGGLLNKVKSAGSVSLLRKPAKLFGGDGASVESMLPSMSQPAQAKGFLDDIGL